MRLLLLLLALTLPDIGEPLLLLLLLLLLLGGRLRRLMMLKLMLILLQFFLAGDSDFDDSADGEAARW